MKNRYQKAFDEISPIRSDEELFRAVLDRKAEDMKATRKIGKKAIVILAAAAVLLGMTTVGVGAAYQWNLTAAFEGLFRDRRETYGEKADPGIDFSQIGKEIGESWSGEGYTLTIEGAVADEGDAYFYYTLAFDETFPYEYGAGKPEWVVDISTILLLSDGEPLIIGSSSKGADCKWLDENTFQGVFCVKSREASLTDRALTLMVGGISHYAAKDDGSFERQEVACGLSAELFFDGHSDYEPVTIAPNAKIGSGFIDELTISSFSAEYILSGDLDSMDPMLSHLCITLRDGTVVEAFDVMGSGADGKLQYHTNYLYPIDPAEVASVRIGDTVIDLTDR